MEYDNDTSEIFSEKSDDYTEQTNPAETDGANVVLQNSDAAASDSDDISMTEDLAVGGDVEDDDSESPINDDDSEEKADEVGVGFATDSYGREILSPVFENYLRMSVNSVKLAYSALKNAIMSYEGVKQRFGKKSETFSLNGEKIFRFEIGDEELLFYPLSSKVKNQEVNKSITVRKDRPGEKSSLRQALMTVDKFFNERKTEKIPSYSGKAYAARYAVNPQAVVAGREHIPPVDGQYDSDEYAPVQNELLVNIVSLLMPENFSVEDKKGQEKLDAIRQQATTVKAAVSLTEPVVYFYAPALNKDNTLAYISVSQVLNDKFLGKMLPQQFTAIAESSDRIERLNLLTVEELSEVSLLFTQYCFCVDISCRFLIKDSALARIAKALPENNERIIFSFDSAMVEAVGKVAFENIVALKKAGLKIMIDNAQNCGIDILTGLPVDYFRIDARYYSESDPMKKAHLSMLASFAAAIGVPLVVKHTETLAQAKFFLENGVTVVEGNFVLKPVRQVQDAAKKFRKLPLTEQ